MRLRGERHVGARDPRLHATQRRMLDASREFLTRLLADGSFTADASWP